MVAKRLFYEANESPGTLTQPSMSTRALRLMMAFVTVHWPFTSFVSPSV